MIGKELKYFLLTISVIAHVRLVSSADAQSAAPAQASSLGEDTPAEAAAPAPLIPDVIDTNHLAYTLMAQVFPAQLTDSFAPGPFRENAASTISYKMNVCERSELTDCMRTGLSSSDVPARLQGIWWTDGLNDPVQAINYGRGDYDPKTRVMKVSPADDSMYAFEASNSTWNGTSWSISGASAYRAVTFSQLVHHIYLNEDFTFGQMIPTMSIGGFRIYTPPAINSLEMEWIGAHKWRRKTTFATGFDVSGGDYLLKRIINGDGSKGHWFDKGWLSYDDGRKVAMTVILQLCGGDTNNFRRAQRRRTEPAPQK